MTRSLRMTTAMRRVHSCALPAGELVSEQLGKRFQYDLVRSDILNDQIVFSVEMRNALPFDGMRFPFGICGSVRSYATIKPLLASTDAALSICVTSLRYGFSVRKPYSAPLPSQEAFSR